MNEKGVLAVIAVAMLIALLWPSAARADGKHALAFSANPVHVGDAYVVHLSGFSPNWVAVVEAEYPSGDVYAYACKSLTDPGCTPDADGDLDVPMTALEAGTIRHDAYSQSSYYVHHAAATGDLEILP